MILPWHLTLICHDTWHLLCLWHWYAMTFDIDGSLSWHLISDMWHLVFDIWHWNYMIWYSKMIFAQTYLFFTDGLWGCINNLKTAVTWNFKKIWGWGWRWGWRWGWGWDEMRWGWLTTFKWRLTTFGVILTTYLTTYNFYIILTTYI